MGRILENVRIHLHSESKVKMMCTAYGSGVETSLSPYKHWKCEEQLDLVKSKSYTNQHLCGSLTSTMQHGLFQTVPPFNLSDLFRLLSTFFGVHTVIPNTTMTEDNNFLEISPIHLYITTLKGYRDFHPGRSKDYCRKSKTALDCTRL